MFTTVDGRRVVTAARVGAGGQGEVFGLVEPVGSVLKRYFDGELGSDPTLPDRLAVMAAATPARPHSGESEHILLAWPTDLVTDGDTFVGYLMPLIDRSSSLPLHRVANPSDARRSTTIASRWARYIDWSYLVTAAANLALAVQVLHRSGVVIGDFNENNVLIWNDARVTLLDCDSMQITDPSGRHYLCKVGRAEFTPPELFRANWGHTVRAPSSDLFALAVHIHQLIMEGEHPFRGVWRGAGEKPTAQALAVDGVWAYGGDPRLRPRPRAVTNDILSPEVRELFERAFVDGAINPRARPTAEEWNGVLLALLRSLVPCGVQPRHHYRRELTACPWCGQEKERARQIARTPVRPPAPAPRPQARPARPARPPRPPTGVGAWAMPGAVSGTSGAVSGGAGPSRPGRRGLTVQVATGVVLVLASLAYIGIRLSQPGPASDVRGVLHSAVAAAAPLPSPGPRSGSASAGRTAPAAVATTVPTPTTAACPAESPQAQVTVTASSATAGNLIWKVTARGTASNGSDASIEIFDVAVALNLTSTSGRPYTLPDYLYGPGDTPDVLAPGQSVALSDNGGDPAVTSATEPSAGTVTVRWNWPAGSPYQRCPV